MKTVRPAGEYQLSKISVPEPELLQEQFYRRSNSKKERGSSQETAPINNFPENV